MYITHNPTKPNPESSPFITRIVHILQRQQFCAAYFLDKWVAINRAKACKIHASPTIHHFPPLTYLQQEGSPITLNQFTNCHLSNGERKNDFIFQTTEFLHALLPPFPSIPVSFYPSRWGTEGWREWNLFGSGSIPVNRSRRSWKELAIIRN